MAARPAQMLSTTRLLAPDPRKTRLYRGRRSRSVRAQAVAARLHATWLGGLKCAAMTPRLPLTACAVARSPSADSSSPPVPARVRPSSNLGPATMHGSAAAGAPMAKSESKAARQAYKRAIVDCLQAIQTLNPEGDAGVTFWRDELDRVLSRQVGKLAGVELPEVKVARHAGDVALAKITAERDALAARLASLGRGERAKVRESRQEAQEAWDRLQAVETATRQETPVLGAATALQSGCESCVHAWGCDARSGSALEDSGASCGWYESGDDAPFFDDDGEACHAN